MTRPLPLDRGDGSTPVDAPGTSSRRRLAWLAGVVVAAIALVAVCAAAAYAWWPLREAFYTDAESIREDQATARLRDVLWEPAKGVEELGALGSELYEPRISADGSTLFFVRGKAGENADIFTARRTLDGWVEPRPLEGINTEDDDLGPQPSADGRHLYFYSNRGGGLGGYDLWVARRLEGEDVGFAEPANLGPAVNSPFNEYGPAVTPAGDLLYFASNRPQLGDARQPDPDAWPGTIREDLFHRTYDLYVSVLGPSGANPATPLATLNTPWNEGSPAVTPTGDFLYFASDRPGGSGAFDLYRARRLRGATQPAENLGPAVNSPSNDLDPALGMGGFALLFSSDRTTTLPSDALEPMAPVEGRARSSSQASAPPPYRLYSTNSREVFLDVRAYTREFDWAAFWWRLGTGLLWALLALLLLLALLALARDMQKRQLSLLARCLLASLALHLTLLLLLSLWHVTASMMGPPRRGGGLQVALAAPAQAEGLAGQIRGAIVEAVSASLPAPPTIHSAVPQLRQGLPLTIATLDAPARLVETAEPWTPPSWPPAAVTPSPERAVVRSIPDLRMPEFQPLSDVALPAAPRPSEAAEQRRANPELPVREGRHRAPPATVASSVPHRLAELAPAAQLPRTAEAPQADRFAALLRTPRDTAPPSPVRTPLPLVDIPHPRTSAHFDMALPRDVAPPVSLAESEPAPPVDVLAPTSSTTRPAPKVMLPPSAANDAVTIAPPQVTLPVSAEASPRLAAFEAPVDVVPDDAIAKTPAPVLEASAPSLVPIRESAFRLPESRAAALMESEEQTPLTLEIDLPATTARADAPSVVVAVPSEPIAVEPIAYDRLSPNLPDPDRLPMPAMDATTASVADRLARSSSLASVVEASTPSLPQWNVELETQPHASAFPQRDTERRSELTTSPSRDDLENAVAMALRWLADHQGRDGRWDGKGFDAACGRCGGAGTADTPVALTSLSMLAFQASGHDHLRPGPFRKALHQALQWLLSKQSESGGIGGEESLYSHALATLALADALAMSGDATLRSPLARAVEFLEAAEGTADGGWSTEVGEPADTAVTGWVVHALAAARTAGISPKPATLDRAAAWFAAVSSSVQPGAYGFQPESGFTPAMTAEGLFAQQLLGRRPDEPVMRASAALIQRERVDWSTQPDTYLWYFATLALREYRGDAPSRWVASVLQELSENQERSGTARGSWNPAAPWSQAGGRVYQTAIGALILQSPWRYPLQADPVDAVPVPDDVVGIIRGLVFNAENSAPLAGATVRLDLADRPAIQVQTDEAGRYLLYTPELPPFFALTAAHEGFTPRSVNASSAILLQPGRSFREGIVVDFTLDPERESVVSVEAVPELHHLGDDRFDGQINSRFQKSAEGAMFQATFELTADQLPPRFTSAELRVLVKGVQYPHRFYINDVLLDEQLDEAPQDGSFGEFVLPFDPGVLWEGDNTLILRAGGRPGDVDDFEFVNLRVYLSR